MPDIADIKKFTQEEKTLFENHKPLDINDIPIPVEEKPADPTREPADPAKKLDKQQKIKYELPQRDLSHKEIAAWINLRKINRVFHSILSLDFDA